MKLRKLTEENYKTNRSFGECNGKRPIYYVVELYDNDLYDWYFDSKEEALAYIDSVGGKCYLQCIEYDGLGDYKIAWIPHT